MQLYKGDLLDQSISIDMFFGKFVGTVFMPEGEEKTAKMNAIKEKDWVTSMNLLEKYLPKDKKFINGDQLTTHDFTVGGWLLNFLVNPNCVTKAWADELYEVTPQRVKTYIECLQEEFKDYLANRPVSAI